MSFRQFIFDHIPSNIKSDIHWKPQHMMHGLSKYDHVIKIEHIEQGAMMLNEKYSITPPLNCNHGSFHHVDKKQHVPEAYDLKFKNLSALLGSAENKFTAPTYDSFYNDEIQQQVYKLYQQDVDLYKYTYEYE